MYALTAAMTTYAREHRKDLARIANSIDYADKMPPDFSTILMKDYMYIEKDFKEKLLKIPAFSKWLQTKGKYINGSVCRKNQKIYTAASSFKNENSM